MKIKIPFLILVLLTLGCQNKEQLAFEPVQFSSKTCADCPNISIEIPNAIEGLKISNSINTALKEEIILLLNFGDNEDITTIEEAITSFKNGHAEMKKLYPTESDVWETKITSEVTFENTNIITLQLHYYMFTGGAHGYGAIIFLNFNKKTGEEMENWELFKDPDHFMSFAESKFRIQETVPQDDPINSTGFMFENEIFHLPENIGFTKEGLQLCYNPYEVASYSEGAIIMTLPFNEVKNYVALKLKP